MIRKLNRREYLAALSSPVIASATGCLHGESRAEHEGWRMHGYDAANTWHKPNATGPKEEVSVKWEDSISYGSGGGEAPLGPGSVPSVADGVVYVGSLGKGSLLAYNAETGGKLWDFEMGYKVTGTPAVMDGRVYIDQNENLYALDAETGDLLWEVELNTGSVGPKVYDGKVFVIGSETRAIDAENGEKLWSSEYGTYGDSGAVADGEVYVGQRALHSLDAETGEENWSVELDDGHLIFGQTVADGLLYTGTSGNTVYAVNTDNGEVIWEVEDFPAHATYAVRAYPAVDEKRVYFTEAPRIGDRTLHAMDKQTGEELWSYNEARDTPAIVDGVVYLQRRDIVALDAETGDEIFNSPSMSLTTSPVVVDGRIYAGGDFHNIVAYSTDS